MAEHPSFTTVSVGGTKTTDADLSTTSNPGAVVSDDTTSEVDDIA